MADTIIPVASSSSYASKLWSAALHQDMIMGEPILADAISCGALKKVDDLVRSAGDRVRIPYNKRLTGVGILGDAPKRPTTKQMERAYHDVNIDKLSSPVVYAKSDGTISQQRTAFDLDVDMYSGVSDWFKQRMIAGYFNQLGGNTASSITYDGDTYTGSSLVQITGLNASVAPSTYRTFYATGSSDANVAADSSATLTLQAVDELEAEAMTQRAGVNNFKQISGKPYKYKFYVPITGFKNLKQQAQASGNLTFPQILLNQEAGGKNSTAYIGDSFVYSMTEIIAIPDHYMPGGVTAGVTQANTKRAIFVGAEACCLAFGKGYSKGNGDPVAGFNVLTDNDDIEETVETAATGIFGFAKTIVDTYDQSVMTYSFYVA